jgi:hypothetical protein
MCRLAAEPSEPRAVRAQRWEAEPVEQRPEAAEVSGAWGPSVAPGAAVRRDAGVVQPQAAVAWAVAAEPQRVAAAVVAQQDARAVQPRAAAERAAAAGPQPVAGEPNAARRREVQPAVPAAPARERRPAHAAVVWAVHPGRLRPALAPQPMARSALVIRSLPIASPTMRSLQAAGDEVWSCDLGS